LGLLLEELLQEILGRFSLALSPLVQNWLEEAFIELGHTPESGSSVEEIEFLVVFLVLFPFDAVAVLAVINL